MHTQQKQQNNNNTFLFGHANVKYCTYGGNGTHISCANINYVPWCQHPTTPTCLFGSLPERSLQTTTLILIPVCLRVWWMCVCVSICLFFSVRACMHVCLCVHLCVGMTVHLVCLDRLLISTFTLELSKVSCWDLCTLFPFAWTRRVGWMIRASITRFGRSGSNPGWVKPMTYKIYTCRFLAWCSALIG